HARSVPSRESTRFLPASFVVMPITEALMMRAYRPLTFNSPPLDGGPDEKDALPHCRGRFADGVNQRACRQRDLLRDRWTEDPHRGVAQLQFAVLPHGHQ